MSPRERLRGDVRWRPGHVFCHVGRYGPLAYEARAWRRRDVSVPPSWQLRLSAFGWQVRLEGNPTRDHRAVKAAEA